MLYADDVTWAELVQKRKSAGFIEQPSARGSHRQFVHPTTKKLITVAVQTKKDVGSGLAHRILRESGLA